MLKRLLFLFLSGFSIVTGAQECPNLISPQNGETDVSVGTIISWNPVEGIPSYQVRLGTTPQGNELGQASVGSAASYTPPLGLPENTRVYVTIVLEFLFQAGEDIVCDSQSFTTENVTTIPPCTTIRTPIDGAMDVSVFTNISWNYAPTATGYRMNIGSTPGGSDVVNEDVGNVLSFDPAGEFDEDTVFYITIIPYNENGNAINCESFEFTTGKLAPIPGCTRMVTPMNGETNVPLTPRLEWLPVAGATRYRVTIGTTPTNADILDNAIFSSTQTFVVNFEPNKTFFIRIVPFNDAGEAIGCPQETFSTLLGCGPYLDPVLGEFVNLNPEFDFPEVFSFCENDDPLVLTAPIIADGYRWFAIDQFDNRELQSEERNLTVDKEGRYQLEVYDLVVQPGDVIECITTAEFDVVSSEAAIIQNLSFDDQGSPNFRITVETRGGGDYEYAIDNVEGPYQDSNVFNDVAPGNHTFYVRDKNGCGIVEERFEQDLTVEGFPKFFSPNGDNINDFWRFVQPSEADPVILRSIQIYDRYGTFLLQFAQNSPGWDGTFNGQPMPASDYWFLAIDDDNKQFKGHFTLKR